MDKFLIKGGKPLHGTVQISGAKNSALPVMAAALLTAEKVTLHNIPKVRDLITMSKLLAFMGAKVSITDIPASDYVIEAVTLNDAVAPYELVKTMRASILTLGPAIARAGVAHVSLPGGCAIGARPVDLHLAALEKMGAEITTSHGYIEAKVPNYGRLKGAHIVFEKITVTGTENILMAAVWPMARRYSKIRHASPKSPTSSTCCAKWARRSKAIAAPRCAFAESKNCTAPNTP